VGGEYADDDKGTAQRVSDQRAAVDAAALGREDVEHGLADQKSPTEDGYGRRPDQHAEQQNDAEGKHLDQLQERVGRQLFGKRVGEVGDDVLGGLDAH